MDQYDSPTEILPGLWIGNMYTASDVDFFLNNEIGAVLNCTKDVPNFFCDYSVKYLRLPIDDRLQKSDLEEMNYYLPIGVKFIFDNYDKNKTNILVHCHKGVQRSVTNVVAYLCKIKHLSIRDAINVVVRKRSVAYFGGKQINFISSLIKFCGN